MTKRIYILVISLIIIFLFVDTKIVRVGFVNSNRLSKTDINPNNRTKLIYFYEPTPNIKKNKAYLDTYTINDDRLNERYNYSVGKPENIFRIITLGDSFTYGLNVSTKDNWTEQLEDELNNSFICKKYNKFEIINLGMYGYDMQYSVERFMLRGDKYEPDLILWMVTDNNINQVNEIIYSKAYSYKDGSRSDVLDGYTYGKREKQILDYQKEQINQFFSQYKEKITFVTFPFLNNFPQRSLEELLLGQQDKITYIRLDDIYISKENYFNSNFLPTVKGHTLIAEDISTYLKETDAIPCD